MAMIPVHDGFASHYLGTYYYYASSLHTMSVGEVSRRLAKKQPSNMSLTSHYFTESQQALRAGPSSRELRKAVSGHFPSAHAANPKTIRTFLFSGWAGMQVIDYYTGASIH